MKELAIHVSQISCYKINKLQKPDQRFPKLWFLTKNVWLISCGDLIRKKNQFENRIDSHIYIL